MPSAANIKVDKQITSETASVESASNQQNTPIKQAIVIIEHKIRNLEKRKVIKQRLHAYLFQYFDILFILPVMFY